MNIIRRYFYGAVSHIISWVWNFCSIGNSINGKLIVYHHIGNEVTDSLDSCRCSLKVFERTLENLSSIGYQFVTINEALDIIDRKLNIKFVVITFDDIQKSVFSNAYPVLKNKQIPFIIYITTDFIDKEGFVSGEQLDILCKEPLCTFGAHTITHPFLRYINNSMFEIQESKRVLENIIGKPVEHFAYPYGSLFSFNRKNIEEVKLSGFKSAVSTIPADISKCSSKNRYFLPRVVINR